MNNSDELQRLLQKAKTIQNQVLSTGSSEEPLTALENIRKAYDEIVNIVTHVHYVNEQLKLIRNSLHGYISTNIKNLKHDLDILEDPQAGVEDIVNINSNGGNMHEIAPGVLLPVITVKYEDLIPSSPLYYISSTNQYAVKILDSVISGQVGFIADNTKKIYNCKLNHDHCLSKCRYFHPGEIPTWSYSNWIYTPQTLSTLNRRMRHIGSRDTLASDIRQSTKQERDMRSLQTMHDILIKLCMDNIVR